MSKRHIVGNRMSQLKYFTDLSVPGTGSFVLFCHSSNSFYEPKVVPQTGKFQYLHVNGNLINIGANLMHCLCNITRIDQLLSSIKNDFHRLI